MSRRRTTFTVVAAAAVLLIVAGILIAGRLDSSHGARSAAEASASASAVRPSAGPDVSGRPGLASGSSGRPLVPTSGAYLGAYVKPKGYTAPQFIASFESLERQLGHPLTLVHSYHPWLQPFPSADDKYFVDRGKVLLLTWGGDPNTRAIIAGKDDSMIRTRAKAVKALHHPILMEFRHEMDRPNLQWTIHGPADYIGAFDRIRAIFTAVGATNVSWVFCPTGYGFQVGRAAAFYPGDNEVSWVCADVYSTSTSQSLAEAAGPFLRWAAQTHKPVLIGEFAAGGNQSGWAAWLKAAGQLAKSDPQIKAMAYFDANGTDSNGHPFQYWIGDSRPALAALSDLLAQQYFHPAVPGNP